MGVFTYHEESASSVAPSRLYKALVLDFDKLVPKIMEAVLQSIEILQGNGGPGTTKKITFLEGGETKYVVQKVEEKDDENYVYKYKVEEGSALEEGVEKMTFDLKAEKGANGSGSVWKVTVTYFTKTDAPPSEEELTKAKAQGQGLFKAVEAYLLAHPDY